ncbi:hypothetical protein DSM43518_04044 [Mycobacterium marinum]|uniref:hypothetical protein n=1 Tax=Mycobacterium marinum TaxID=1781 RepID=UPI000EC68B04|nr:hypothetical protein [Mycobacterium marinum]RFZ05475.1 hypothetical protein DSM43518_04044 [Mycobacterium marinum]
MRLAGRSGWESTIAAPGANLLRAVRGGVRLCYDGKVFEDASAEQARAILAAAHCVTQQTIDPADPRSGRGEGVVVAAGRLLLAPPWR